MGSTALACWIVHNNLTRPVRVDANAALTLLSIEAVGAFVWLACAARAGADAQQLTVAGHLLTLN